MLVHHICTRTQAGVCIQTALNGTRTALKTTEKALGSPQTDARKTF